jgi:hypothetical protein
MDAHDHQRRRTALDRLADVFADALERIAPFALDLVGENLDIDARQVIGQRLTPSRLRARVLADALLVEARGRLLSTCHWRQWRKLDDRDARVFTQGALMSSSSSSSASLVNALGFTVWAARVSALCARWSLWFALPFLAGCGAPAAHCRASSDCAPAQICVPSPLGATYCSALDSRCPSGLRWASRADSGLAGQCVTLVSDGGLAAPGDGGSLSLPDFGACAGQTDGVVCAPSNDPCKQPGRCRGGVCQPIGNADDGTACGIAADGCHTAPACQGGVCQPGIARPDGYNYDTSDSLAQCCGGAPVKINSVQNCGVCGNTCGAGSGCVMNNRPCDILKGCPGSSPSWLCTCSPSSQCMLPICCNGLCTDSCVIAQHGARRGPDARIKV